jgi:hypothetical protein
MWLRLSRNRIGFRSKAIRRLDLHRRGGPMSSLSSGSGRGHEGGTDERDEAPARRPDRSSLVPRRSPMLLIREALGLNDLRSRDAYVSDGGHYENLGLVELLRRGAAESYASTPLAMSRALTRLSRTPSRSHERNLPSISKSIRLRSSRNENGSPPQPTSWARFDTRDSQWEERKAC